MNHDATEKPVVAAGLKLLHSGVGITEIRHSLETNNYPAAEIDEALEIIKKYHYARRRKRGVTNLLIGAGLLMVGAIAALAMHDNSAGFRIALYVPCIAGSLLVCWGLVDTLG